MKNKALHFMAAAVLSSALLMTGCGSHSGDTNSSTKQTQDQTQRGAGQDSAQTSAAEDQNQASDDQNQSQDTQTPETHQDLETRVETEVVQQPETQAPDTENNIDNPAADNGEGDSNGFYDDGGTWITVHKNSQGQWVDESGMTYQFGDDGVTDQNGVFYPY